MPFVVIVFLSAAAKTTFAPPTVLDPTVLPSDVPSDILVKPRLTAKMIKVGQMPYEDSYQDERNGH